MKERWLLSLSAVPTARYENKGKEVKKMLFYRSSVNFTPQSFYRTPDAIKEDIRKISARIAEVNEMLNVRELLSEYLDDGSFDAKRAIALNELLEFAKEALDELIELNSTLDGLKSELITSISVLG